MTKHTTEEQSSNAITEMMDESTTVANLSAEYKELKALINQYLAKVPAYDNCATLMAELFGDEPYFACDEMYEMKLTMVDLIAFLAKPDIAQQFAEYVRFTKQSYPTHLRRILWFFIQADNENIQAEILKEYIRLSSLGHPRELVELKKKYTKLLKGME